MTNLPRPFTVLKKTVVKNPPELKGLDKYCVTISREMEVPKVEFDFLEEGKIYTKSENV